MKNFIPRLRGMTKFPRKKAQPDTFFANSLSSLLLLVGQAVDNVSRPRSLISTDAQPEFFFAPADYDNDYDDWGRRWERHEG